VKVEKLALSHIILGKTTMNILDEIVLNAAHDEEYQSIFIVSKKKGETKEEDLFRITEFDNRSGNGFFVKMLCFDREDYDTDDLFQEYCTKAFLSFFIGASNTPITVIKPDHLYKSECIKFDIEVFERSGIW